MEIKVTEITLPESIPFNYEELKAEITEKVSYYSNLAYTEDMIAEAKKDKAELNKLKKALNDERIRRKKEYMKPFEEFEAMVKELVGIIDEPIGIIDSQVKEYEARMKEEKREAIQSLFDAKNHPEGLTLEQIFDEKWLNATVSMKKIDQAMVEIFTRYSTDMLTLSSLPEYSFEAQEEYKKTLDIGRAVAYATRLTEIARAKAEAEAEKAKRDAELEAEAKAVLSEKELAALSELETAEPTTDEPEELPFTDEGLPDFEKLAPKKWYTVSMELDRAQAEEIKSFLISHEIQFVIREV